MRFKDSTIILSMTPAIVAILQAAEAAYAAIRVPCWVTSGNDGRHMNGSFHYRDRAVDFRTGHHWQNPLLTQAEAEEVAAAMRQRLGQDYDVVLESDHLHVEFDVRRESDAV